MRIQVGSWVTGKPTAAPGTIEWAGGLVDFSRVPLTTYIKSINVTGFTNGVKDAVYHEDGDRSGTSESIVVDTMDMMVLEGKGPDEGLSKGAIAGVVIGVITPPAGELDGKETDAKRSGLGVNDEVDSRGVSPLSPGFKGRARFRRRKRAVRLRSMNWLTRRGAKYTNFLETCRTGDKQTLD